MLNAPLSCGEGSTLLTAGLNSGHRSRATLVAKCLEAGELAKHGGNGVTQLGLDYFFSASGVVSFDYSSASSALGSNPAKCSPPFSSLAVCLVERLSVMPSIVLSTAPTRFAIRADKECGP